MKGLLDALKDNLISAAYPRGGGEHLTRDILGVKKESVLDTRTYDKFKSLKEEDP